MPPSEELINWHHNNCPDIDINSIDFTEFFLSEISKLKNKPSVEKGNI